MSPEQAAGDILDGRSDVYSLGCVLYEMLVGRPTFTAPNARALVARHLFADAPSVRTVLATVPHRVDRSIARALSKHPSARFQTASDFAAAFDVFETTTVPLPKYRTRNDARSARTHRLRSRPIVRIITASVILSALVAGRSIAWQREARSADDGSRETYPAENVAVLYLEDRSLDG
jgi:serine/threonine protein kinase